jgi:hypothetical protein
MLEWISKNGIIYSMDIFTIIGIVSVIIIVACAIAFGYRKETFSKKCKGYPKKLDVLYGYKVALPVGA